MSPRRRRGGIVGGLLKMTALGAVGLIALAVLAGRPGGPAAKSPPTAADPAPVVAPPPAPGAPDPAAVPVVDSGPLPGFPVPAAGEEILLVNDYGLKLVTIVGRDGAIRVDNPTRARVVTGEPKRRAGLSGLYEVEVLEGEHRGEVGLAHPRAMRMDPPDADEKTREERRQLIEKRRARRARSSP
jgi:hypothetical protein